MRKSVHSGQDRMAIPRPRGNVFPRGGFFSTHLELAY